MGFNLNLFQSSYSAFSSDAILKRVQNDECLGQAQASCFLLV